MKESALFPWHTHRLRIEDFYCYACYKRVPPPRERPGWSCESCGKETHSMQRWFVDGRLYCDECIRVVRPELIAAVHYVADDKRVLTFPKVQGQL